MPRRSTKATRKGKPARRGARPKNGEPGLSRRAFAKLIGVSHTAIEKGIASGRLSKSLGPSGRILNPALGREEWAAGASKPHPNGAASGHSLTEAQRQVALGRATAIRISNRQKRRQLIDGREARRDAYECARTIRDAVLGVVDRVSAELAAEPDAKRVHARLLDELRAALAAASEVLANGE